MRELRVVDRDAVLDAGEFFAHLRKTHLGQWRRKNIRDFDSPVKQFAGEFRVEIAVRLVSGDIAAQFLPRLFKPQAVFGQRQNLRRPARTHRSGILFHIGAGPEDNPNRFLRIGEFLFYGCKCAAAGAGKIEMHGAEFAQTLQGRAFLRRDADKIEMFHLHDHRAVSSCTDPLPRLLAILPRVTAAVCSSPSAILITLIASLHSGIFTFSKRLTRWLV